jgi:hypothetical protein
MTRKQAIKKTLFKFIWIRDHLKRNQSGMHDKFNFNRQYNEYGCSLCDLFCEGNWLNPNCPKCILNSDNCFNMNSGYYEFLKETSIPKKRKYCDWVIKKCEEALEAK